MTEKLIKAEESPKGSIADEVRQFVADGGCLEDVVEHGCASGSVPGLIYYADTAAFFSRHREEIVQLVGELVDGTRCGLGELFRDWDNSDPLANEAHNQNLLAWFGFEEVAQHLLEEEE